MDLQEQYVKIFKRDLRSLEYHFSQFSKIRDGSVTRFVKDFSYHNKNHMIMLQGMFITGNLRNVISMYMIREANRLRGDIITAKFSTTEKKQSTANL